MARNGAGFLCRAASADSSTFVDFDRGLNKAINHLREALGDSADQPRFIETFPRKGYRFIAPVTHDDQTSQANRPEGASRRLRVGTWMLAAGAGIACLGILVVVNFGGIRDW